MTDAPSAEFFTPHIAEAMSLPNGQKLTLVSVDKRNWPRDASRAAFSLLLRGVPDPITPEGMHRVTFEDGASFELYLIPSTRRRENIRIIRLSSTDPRPATASVA